MPDRRSHRGAHPDDARLFAPDVWPKLQIAVQDLCWLLDRGYSRPSALKLVGDRYALEKRQRTAISRCACSKDALERRRHHRAEPSLLKQTSLWLDGYNVLTTIEAALAGGVILAARDGCYRDMASMHGSYRKVEETLPALRILGELTAGWNLGELHWLLDRPVSNSGRLKGILLKIAAEYGWNWKVELVRNPDTLLIDTENAVVTADSAILDRCQSWINLARLAITEQVPQAFLVDLSEESPNATGYSVLR